MSPFLGHVIFEDTMAIYPTCHVLLQCFSGAGGVLLKIVLGHSLLTMKVQE